MTGRLMAMPPNTPSVVSISNSMIITRANLLFCMPTEIMTENSRILSLVIIRTVPKSPKAMTIYSILAGILIVTVIGACIGGPALFALWITDLACVIIAAVKANNGETFTYPISIRFIK